MLEFDVISEDVWRKKRRVKKRKREQSITPCKIKQTGARTHPKRGRERTGHAEIN